MHDSKLLAGKRISISISESDDIFVHGLGHIHLRQALADVSLHILSAGAELLYGGDLRKDGFTELLFEVCARYHDRSNGKKVLFTNYLPYGVHYKKPHLELMASSASVEPYGKITLLSMDAMHTEEISIEKTVSNRNITRAEWAACLTAARTMIATNASAAVLLGGRLTGYLGVMPGIAEEALINLRLNKPVYLLGGFGGCAATIYKMLSGEQVDLAAAPWLSEFQGMNLASLNNGLGERENALLGSSKYIDSLVPYLIHGISVAVHRA